METRTNTQRPPVQDSYTPPPSQLGGRGFAAFAAAPAEEDRNRFPEQEPEHESGLDSDSRPSADLPRPARAVSWRNFDALVRGMGPDGGGEGPDELYLEPEHDRLATAALIASLSGLVTGVGFLVGTVMGQVALRRIGRAGWFERNEPARRRSRNAVMIGCTGMAFIAAAALFIAGWWLVHAPLETLLPGLAPGTAPSAPAGGVS